MIEKLLQFLVAKIDAHLLEPVEVEDFEAGDVQHSDEANPMDKQLDSKGHKKHGESGLGLPSH